MKPMIFNLRCPDRLTAIITVAISAVFFCCCEKDPEPLFNHGMIYGRVSIQTLDYYTTEGKNVRVIAHGPYGSPSTLTDSDGKYKLSGLGNGTYEIEFVKDGFGPVKKENVKIFGNDTAYVEAGLIAMSDYIMPRLGEAVYYLPNEDRHTVGIKTNLSSSEIMWIRVFLNDTKSVSYKNFKYEQIAYTYQTNDGAYLMTFQGDPKIEGTDVPIFQTGQPRYMIAYVCNLQEFAYFDVINGVFTYTTIDLQQHSKVYEIQFDNK